MQLAGLSPEQCELVHSCPDTERCTRPASISDSIIFIICIISLPKLEKKTKTSKKNPKNQQQISEVKSNIGKKVNEALRNFPRYQLEFLAGDTLVLHSSGHNMGVFFPDPNRSLELLSYSTQTMPVVLELISQPIMCIPVYKQWLQHAENLQATSLHLLNSSACMWASLK